MNRILIAAADPATAQASQSTLAANGFQTAVVSDCSQLVAFCQQHTPDLTVIDLNLGGGSVWSAIQALRQDSRLSAMPLVGLSNQPSEPEIQYGLRLGMLAIDSKPVNPASFLSAVRNALQAPAVPSNVTPMPMSAPSSSSGNDPVSRLLAQTREIRELTAALKPHVPSFGDEAPELFTYIENSGAQIWEELSRIGQQGPERSAIALQDKDLRHDFRNMIGSVTGFSELLLMEPTVEGECRTRFTRIREICRAFCDLLDEQKAAAAA